MLYAGIIAVQYISTMYTGLLILPDVLSEVSCQTRVSNDCLSRVSEAGKMLGGAATAHPSLDALLHAFIRPTDSPAR